MGVHTARRIGELPGGWFGDHGVGLPARPYLYEILQEAMGQVHRRSHRLLPGSCGLDDVLPGMDHGLLVEHGEGAAGGARADGVQAYRLRPAEEETVGLSNELWEGLTAREPVRRGESEHRIDLDFGQMERRRQAADNKLEDFGRHVVRVLELRFGEEPYESADVGEDQNASLGLWVHG